MTKILHAPILIDERTAIVVRNQLSPKVARLRRVAVVKPYGLGSQAGSHRAAAAGRPNIPSLTDQNIADYEQALDDLIAGRWPQAFERLHRVPAEDRVKDFLTVFIAQHNRTPPENWNGVIPLTTK